MKHFLILFYVSQALGILAVIFLIIVVAHKGSNTNMSSAGEEFLWHPVLMSVSFGYIFSTSITIYRALRYFKKIFLKRIHTALHLVAIAFAIGGVATVFDLRNSYNGPHLRSLHSLLGIVTLILFCIQWVYSFLLFLYPQGPVAIRGMMMPHHVLGGMVLYVTALCTLVSGINQYNSDFSGSLNSEAVLLNFAGFFTVMNAILVGYMVLKEDYRRQPIEEDRDGGTEVPS